MIDATSRGPCSRTNGVSCKIHVWIVGNHALGLVVSAGGSQPGTLPHAGRRANRPALHVLHGASYVWWPSAARADGGAANPGRPAHRPLVAGRDGISPRSHLSRPDTGPWLNSRSPEKGRKIDFLLLPKLEVFGPLVAQHAYILRQTRPLTTPLVDDTTIDQRVTDRRNRPFEPRPQKGGIHAEQVR